MLEPTLQPVRITMTSERYEVAASLFDSVFGDLADVVGDQPPTPVSSSEEMMMGIFADGSADDYFVKPADPAVLRAKKTGEPTEAIEQIDLITEGILTIVPDQGYTDEPSSTVTISYDETELTGMEGARSTITYRTCEPGLVTMIRTGMVSTALTFKAHHHAICTYDTPYMPFSIGIHALIVDNRLDTDGELKLDYIIEIRGARAERCEMTMKIAKG